MDGKLFAWYGFETQPRERGDMSNNIKRLTEMMSKHDLNVILTEKGLETDLSDCKDTVNWLTVKEFELIIAKLNADEEYNFKRHFVKN